MCAIFTRVAFAAVALAGLSAAAHAEVLASADYNSVDTLPPGWRGFYPPDGTNTVLTFNTTKPNQVIQFSFSASVCGIVQTAAQTASPLSNTQVLAWFAVDNSFSLDLVDGTICEYRVLPQGAGMQQMGGGERQARIVIPTVGTHTVSVLVNVLPADDGTNIFPVLGHTHTMVSK